jgi:AcrR family transcriptional regulator
MNQNAIPNDDDVAARVASRTLSRREATYADEVRRLLDAALAVMQRLGTTGRPRVQDIVAEAGLSNDAFYRHFGSKDALVAALLEDGAQRLASYLRHQTAKASSPRDRVRTWVQGVLAQTEGELASSTRAVLWNGGSVDSGAAAGRHFASAPLAQLLAEAFTELGSTEPALDAALVTHAVLGRVADHLWQQTEPSGAEVEHLVEFALRSIAGQRRRGR